MASGREGPSPLGASSAILSLFSDGFGSSCGSPAILFDDLWSPAVALSALWVPEPGFENLRSFSRLDTVPVGKSARFTTYWKQGKAEMRSLLSAALCQVSLLVSYSR